MADLTEGEQAYFADELAAHEGKYLAGTNPRAQSGFGRDEIDWRRYREVILAPVLADGTFLDIGCANGLLMESLVTWSAERGRVIEPFGLEVSARLADLARARLPHWRERIFVGNARDWDPPSRFDYVRTELVYVPRTRRLELVRRLLTSVVTPGGLLIVTSYGSSRPEGARTESLLEELGELPFRIVRVDDTRSEQHGSRRFYATLGLDLTAEKHGGGPAHYSSMLGATVFELYPTSTASSNVRIGLEVADLAAALESVRAIGARVEREPALGGEYALVRDPDGNQVELSQQHGTL